jgi:glycosyltransferase involved in cell wall biosynthesis
MALTKDIHYIGSRKKADEAGQLMNRQRVLFLSASAGEYGAENALLDLIRSLSDNIEPIVLVPEHGSLVNSLATLGVTCKVVPFAVLSRRNFSFLGILVYKAAAIVSVFRLLREFRRLRPSVIHTNNILIFPGAIAARLLGIPHVWHIREVIASHHLSPFFWNIWRWIILILSERIVCISSAVRDQFGESRKVVVVHDGIDTLLFRPAPSARGKKDVRIGIIGRLEHRRKGQDTFIEAARIALETRNELQFVIVGHEREDIDNREQSLRETVLRYGLSEKIRFRGLVQRDQMVAAMQELDVLVLCSKQPEGLGIVLLEAMACGKSVISFAEGGPLDIIQDHVNGLLVPPQNVEKLAEAMLELARDLKLRKSLGVEGRKTVENSFGREKTAREMEKLYREITRVRN